LTKANVSDSRRGLGKNGGLFRLTAFASRENTKKRFPDEALFNRLKVNRKKLAGNPARILKGIFYGNLKSFRPARRNTKRKEFFVSFFPGTTHTPGASLAGKPSPYRCSFSETSSTNEWGRRRLFRTHCGSLPDFNFCRSARRSAFKAVGRTGVLQPVNKLKK
jgi:hypothetical protein